MVVCQCRRLSHRKVAKAVEGGCTSLRSLCDSTGAGQSCGGCVGSLKKLIEQFCSTHPVRDTHPDLEPAHEAA